MNYSPTKKSDRTTDAIMAVYDSLPDDEKAIITKQAQNVNRHLDKFRASNDRAHNMAQERSLVELVGKLGMWMNKKEQHKITKQ